MPCQNHPAIHDGLAVCWRCRREFCPSCRVELRHYFFCAGCKTAQVRDMLAGTDMFSPDYASMERRFGAWLIDGIIKTGIYVGVFAFTMGVVGSLAQPGNQGANNAVLLVFFFAPLASNAYEFVLHAFNNGQTLGKLAVKIRVVGALGSPITKRQAAMRSMIKYVLFFLTCGSMCISPFVGNMLDGIFALGEERASLHDLAAKTRVINVD